MWPCVRLLQHGHSLTLVLYTARSSLTQRIEIDTQFVYQILLISRYRGWEDDLNGWLDAAAFTTDNWVEMKRIVDEALFPPEMNRNKATNDTDRHLTALRFILEYVMQYGTRQPWRDLLPEIVVAKERERLQKEALQKQLCHQRQVALILWTQCNVRRFLAKKHCQRRSLAMYVKEFDREQKQFVYKYQDRSNRVIYRYKPLSLGDQDVPIPNDEWLVEEEDTNGKWYFNPLRGVRSRLNEMAAVLVIQRWFRRTRWIGHNTWDLRSLSRALRFHNNIITPHADALKDLTQIEQITRYAYHLHVLNHDVR